MLGPTGLFETLVWMLMLGPRGLKSKACSSHQVPKQPLPPRPPPTHPSPRIPKFRDKPTDQMQKKAREEIRHKEFWGPQDPPSRNSLCRPFSCILKGKRSPQHKELAGSGVPWAGGLGGGGSAQILYVYALFWFLNRAHEL